METNKNFILTDEFKINEKGVKLFRIKCIKDFSEIHLGDLGGFIESYENLSDSAWVFHEAEVYGNARVYGNAWVFNNAKVSDNAKIYGNAWVHGNARVYGDANIYGNAEIYRNAKIYGNATVFSNPWISGNAEIFGSAIVLGNTRISDYARITGDSRVSGNARIFDNAEIKSNFDYSCFQSFGRVGRTTIVFREKENKIKIKCGCFSGSVEEFEKEVEETHGDSKFGREYKAIINVIKIKFDLD